MRSLGAVLLIVVLGLAACQSPVLENNACQASTAEDGRVVLVCPGAEPVTVQGAGSADKSFAGIDFTDAIFSRGKYHGCDFTDANLTRVNLNSDNYSYYTELNDSIFVRADMTDILMDMRIKWYGADLTCAVVANSDIGTSSVYWSSPSATCPDGTLASAHSNTCKGYATIDPVACVP